MVSSSKMVLVLSMIFIPFFVCGQDTAFTAKHAAILFPYPMYKEKWRSSIGFTLLTTPEDVTEETRIRLPCGDFHVLYKITSHAVADGRILFQVLQNHVSAGLHYMQPINDKFYLGAGNDMAYWFGFLKLSGFNSKASGWMNYSSLSFGYKTPGNLLISFKAEVALNLYYQAGNGENKFFSSEKYYNGETYTIALEQPFYSKTHITLALSAISNYFNWQTWSLFYKTDRKVFYPQITAGIIL